MPIMHEIETSSDALRFARLADDANERADSARNRGKGAELAYWRRRAEQFKALMHQAMDGDDPTFLGCGADEPIPFLLVEGGADHA